MLAAFSTPVHRMIEFGERASQKILEIRRDGLESAIKDDDFKQVVTKADLAVAQLALATFDVLVSEENSDCSDSTSVAEAYRKLREAEEAFLLDEVDGTANLADLRGDFGTMAARFVKGEVTDALLMLPSLEPCWGRPEVTLHLGNQHGIALLATGGKVFHSPMRGGRLSGAKFLPFRLPERARRHIAWPVNMAKGWTIDYGVQPFGPFAAANTSCIADVANLAYGYTRAMFFFAKLWDFGPLWLLTRTLGLNWYRVSDLANPPADITEMFDDNFNAREPWLIARSEQEAADIIKAIRKVA